VRRRLQEIRASSIAVYWAPLTILECTRMHRSPDRLGKNIEEISTTQLRGWEEPMPSDLEETLTTMIDGGAVYTRLVKASAGHPRSMFVRDGWM